MGKKVRAGSIGSTCTGPVSNYQYGKEKTSWATEKEKTKEGLKAGQNEIRPVLTEAPCDIFGQRKRGCCMYCMTFQSATRQLLAI